MYNICLPATQVVVVEETYKISFKFFFGKYMQRGTLGISGRVWGATCGIGIVNIASLINVVNFAMDDWFYQLGAPLCTMIYSLQNQNQQNVGHICNYAL